MEVDFVGSLIFDNGMNEMAEYDIVGHFVYNADDVHGRHYPEIVQ